MTVNKQALQKAIDATKYKYFGDYEMDEAQHDAVQVLVRYAEAALQEPDNSELVSALKRICEMQRKAYMEGANRERLDNLAKDMGFIAEKALSNPVQQEANDAPVTDDSELVERFKDSFDNADEKQDGYYSMLIHRADAESIITALQQKPVVDSELAFDDYDAGYLNDYGGGDIDWWQDYIRAEIERANEHWQSQITALQQSKPVPDIEQALREKGKHHPAWLAAADYVRDLLANHPKLEANPVQQPSIGDGWKPMEKPPEDERTVLIKVIGRSVPCTGFYCHTDEEDAKWIVAKPWTTGVGECYFNGDELEAWHELPDSMSGVTPIEGEDNEQGIPK